MSEVDLDELERLAKAADADRLDIDAVLALGMATPPSVLLALITRVREAEDAKCSECGLSVEACNERHRDIREQEAQMHNQLGRSDERADVVARLNKRAASLRDQSGSPVIGPVLLGFALTLEHEAYCIENDLPSDVDG